MDRYKLTPETIRDTTDKIEPMESLLPPVTFSSGPELRQQWELSDEALLSITAKGLLLSARMTYENQTGRAGQWVYAHDYASLVDNFFRLPSRQRNTALTAFATTDEAAAAVNGIMDSYVAEVYDVAPNGYLHEQDIAHFAHLSPWTLKRLPPEAAFRQNLAMEGEYAPVEVFLQRMQWHHTTLDGEASGQ